MVPTLAVATLAVLLQMLTQPPYPGFGQPFTVKPVKVVTGQVFVHPGYIVQPGRLTAPVDCNMPMLKPDHDVDPKIVVEPPKDVDFKIRVIEVLPCK